jgi:hypothetical protein
MLDWTTGRPHQFWKTPHVIRFDRQLIGGITMNLLQECALHGESFFLTVLHHVRQRARIFEVPLPLLPNYRDFCMQYLV